MEISAKQVKELRELTGVGFMECKAALTEASGDIKKAVTILRTRGQAKAEKRSGRTTGQGLIGTYIHQGGQVGVLVEMNCESDFVARTEDFQTLLKEIAMHIAASNPICVNRDAVPTEDLEREKNIYLAQAKESKKPQNVIDKIVEGKLNSYYSQIVLLDQPSIRDPKIKISDLINTAIAKLGENITISRFSRFKVGENSE